MVEGAPHTAKRLMINLFVYGVPPSPVYKGVEEGEGRPSTMARPMRAGLLLSPSFIYVARGHPIDTQVDQLIFYPCAMPPPP